MAEPPRRVDFTDGCDLSRCVFCLTAETALQKAGFVWKRDFRWAGNRVGTIEGNFEAVFTQKFARGDPSLLASLKGG
jgi:hypothetical protein